MPPGFMPTAMSGTISRTNRRVWRLRHSPIMLQCMSAVAARSGHALRCNSVSVFGAKRRRVGHTCGRAVLRPRGLSQLHLPGSWVGAGGGIARQRQRGGKTLHRARALAADLSADDFRRRHLALDLKHRSSGRPVANGPIATFRGLRILLRERLPRISKSVAGFAGCASNDGLDL